MLTDHEIADAISDGRLMGQAAGKAARQLVKRASAIALEALIGLALLAPIGYALAWARQRVNSEVQADQAAAAAQVRIANALEKMTDRP